MPRGPCYKGEHGEARSAQQHPQGAGKVAPGDGVFQVITFSRLKNRVGGYHRDYLVLVVWCWLCGVAGPQTTRSTSTSPLTSSSHVSGRLCLGLRRSRRSEACTAYDLAGIYMAQGRVYGVQHVRGHDPGPGDHGTLSARERANPPGGSGAGGKLRHLSSHLTEAILRAMDWHQQACGGGMQLCKHSSSNPSTAPRTI